MTIRDLNIRKATGSNIIAFRPPSGNFIVNPDPDTILEPGASYIVLGNREQLGSLKHYLNERKS